MLYSNSPVSYINIVFFKHGKEEQTTLSILKQHIKISCVNNIIRQRLIIFPQIQYVVSIRSTPYCISQKNIVPLHGGIIFLILRQKNAI